MELAVVRQEVSDQVVKVGAPQDEAETVQELYEMICRRAYELFEARGYEHGHDLDDWFQAEAELFHPVHAKIHHTVNAITVRAELPGFPADQIQVIVEPRHVTLTGSKESSERKKLGESAVTERHMEHVFRVVELPAEVEPSRARATFKDDVLEVVLPKAEKFEVNVRLKAA